MTVPLLYVHPRGHLNDLVVPAGALACVNAASVPAVGRYSFELTDEDLRRAEVLAIDFHWGLSLGGFEALAARARRVRPDLPLIVGGISAGHYANELLLSGVADHVVRGDSEVAFAALVRALLAGEDHGGIPNVVSRGVPLATPRRMTQAEFDATDCLEARWFPTFGKVRDWESPAFSMTPALPVARGCPMRCPTCYGTFASTFGNGYLLRSPEAVARDLRRMAEDRVRSPLLSFGRPPASRLSAVLQAAAAAGPLDFDGNVTAFLCTPPSAEDLEALEAAFRCQVRLSMVPPCDIPELAPDARQRDTEAWAAAARRAAGSKRLSVYASALTPASAAQMDRYLGVVGTSAVTVRLVRTWQLTVPTDSCRPPLAELRDVVAPLWTFYAARLLSPALAGLLERFSFLEDLAEDPEEAVAPAEPLRACLGELLALWREHRLPSLPGLAFDAVPVDTLPETERQDVAANLGGRVHYRGALRYVPSARLSGLGTEGVPLAAHVDDVGVRLEGALPDGVEAIALVPRLAGAAPGTLDAWRSALCESGLAVLTCPSAEGRRLQVNLRVQEAQIAVLAADRRPLAVGKADMGYFRSPRARSRAQRASARRAQRSSQDGPADGRPGPLR